MDLPSRSRWYDYSRARDMMLKATDSRPRTLVRPAFDDKKRARLNCIRHLLSLIPYKQLAARKDQAAAAIKQGQVRRPGEPETTKVRAGTILREVPRERCV
jgi:hypothetical protein